MFLVVGTLRIVRLLVPSIRTLQEKKVGSESARGWRELDLRAIHDRNPNAAEAWVSLHAEWRLLCPIGFTLHRSNRFPMDDAVYAAAASQSTHNKPENIFTTHISWDSCDDY